MAKCVQIIERNTVSWTCNLDSDHEGPHMATEDSKSVRERADWLAEKEASQQAVPTLAELQGEAQTTAERYSDGVTPHPATEKHQKETEMMQGGTQVKDLTMFDPNAKTCQSCNIGDHLSCVQTKQLIAVVFSGQDDLRAWCSCFQADRDSHGVAEIVRQPEAEPASQSEPEPAPEPTKQREGDQVLPRPTGEESVQERIVRKARLMVESGRMSSDELLYIEQAMERSINVGIQRYGSPLQTFNGRNTLQDLEDELRDAFVYVSSINQASQATREQIVGLCQDAVMTANQSGRSMDLSAVIEIAVDTILGAVGSLSVLQGE